MSICSQASTTDSFRKRDEQSIQVLKTRRAASAAALFDLPSTTTSASDTSSSSPLAPLTPSASTLDQFQSMTNTTPALGYSPMGSPKSSKRPHLRAQSSYLSSTSNNNLSISGYERESMSTIWSSADIPVFLDSKTDSFQMSSPPPQEVLMRTPKGTLTSLSVVIDDHDDDSRDQIEELEEDTSKNSMDGPRTVSSPPTSDDMMVDDSIVSYCTRKQRSISAARNITPTKIQSREASCNALPHSVSESSHLTFSTLKGSPNISIKMAPPASNFKQVTRQVTPPDLYTQADKFFSKSYTMLSFSSSSSSDHSKTPSPLLSNLPELPPHMAVPAAPQDAAGLSSRFSDQSHETVESATHQGTEGMVLSPSFSLSRDSRSSAESSNLPDIDDAPTTSTARIMTFSPRSTAQLVVRNGSKSTEEVEVAAKYGFLQSPAPLSMRKSLSTTYGNRIRTASNMAKFAADEPEFEMINTMAATSIRDHRLRARTLGDCERPEISDQRPSRTGIETPLQRIRRPSSNDEVIPQVEEGEHGGYLHRPSNTDTISSSSHCDSSFTSLNNLSDYCGTPTTKINRLPSTPNSQVCFESHQVAGKRVAPNVARPKSKSGSNWASHLSQGLSLHIEQGAKRYIIKMNYLSYDPFGKAESLCLDRPMTPSRPRSKCGNLPDGEGEDSIGLLEFDPSVESLATTHLIFQASPAEAPILRHLVVGDDIKADLISRQADLSIGNIGTREVSGSERKGKMTWRFIYGVEECRFESGQACDGIKTLRPLSFFCSATLLDPTRAKKTRVINLIRKQMGTHIESMPMIGSSSSSSCTSTTSTAASKNASPQVQSLRLDTASISTSQQSSISSSYNQRRPSLIPFKMTRPMMEAVANLGGASRSNSITTTPLIISAPMPIVSPISPVSTTHVVSHQDDARGGRSASEVESVPISQYREAVLMSSRPRGLSVGQYRAPQQNASIVDDTYRNRAASASIQSSGLRRPPTASEEIKQAYLKRTVVEGRRSDTTNTATITPGTNFEQHQYAQLRAGSVPNHGYNALHMSNMTQQPPSPRTRLIPSTSQVNIRRPSTTQHYHQDTRNVSISRQTQVPTSPLALRKQKVMINNAVHGSQGAQWL